jgi:hypothetical protein
MEDISLHNIRLSMRPATGLCPHISLERVYCIRKVTLSLGLLSPPYPLFVCGICKVDILRNLSMKCRYSAFNAQGLRLTIVVVQLGGAVKIYVVAVEALRK